MKNTLTLLLFAATLLFTSCIKDKCTRSYSFYVPVYKSIAEVRANMKSNPARPVEHPGKLFLRGNYIFLNEIDRGIHIIDNTNPAAPRNIAFIDIPGNVDIAVKGNTLYADSYADLVTFDITNPLQATTKKFIDNIFAYRRYANGFVADSTKIIVDWIRKDTTVTVDCGNSGAFFGCRRCVFAMDASGGGKSSDGASSSPFGAGIAGSMARFSVMNNYLYTVTNEKLNVFNIIAPNDPSFANAVSVGWNIETIYPFKDKLFIGSTNGMFIFDTQNPTAPNRLGQFAHLDACDPVIADDKYAFVTLRSGNRCAGSTNRVDVLNIEDLAHPNLVKSYDINNPYGLSKDGNLLFICDGNKGLKIYNVSDVNNFLPVKNIANMQTYDVIAHNKIALVVASDGLYQFDYSNTADIKLLSKIGYKN